MENHIPLGETDSGATAAVAPVAEARAPKPFIKWVGGKRQLLTELHRRLPAGFSSYFEPFIGGGALMWSLHARRPARICINDFNPELTNLYEVVRDRPDALIEDLRHHVNDKDYYYEVRAMDRDPGFASLDAVTRASRFMYLNRTAFNGIYRVNSKGQNNVPFGNYKRPRIVDEDTLMACSRFLSGVTILTGDFQQIESLMDADSFVYFDPPYVPLNATSSFTSYTSNGFDDEMQRRLKRFCDAIDAAGAKFMLSNSATDFIRDLYAGYRIDEVLASRAVNSKSDGRGKVKEVLVRNYG